MFTRFSSAIVLSPSVCIEVLQKTVIRLFCWDDGKQLASFRVTFSLPADRSHDILKTRRLLFKSLGFGRGTILVIIKPMEKKIHFLIKVSVVTQLREMCIVGNFFHHCLFKELCIGFNIHLSETDSKLVVNKPKRILVCGLGFTYLFIRNRFSKLNSVFNFSPPCPLPSPKATKLVNDLPDSSNSRNIIPTRGLSRVQSAFL